MADYNAACRLAQLEEPAIYLFALPPGISFFYIQERFSQWILLHGYLFQWACVQGLYPRAIEPTASTSFVHMVVEPRWDGGTLMRRAFRVKTITARPQSCLELVPGLKVEELMNEVARRQSPGRFGALIVIRCAGLEASPKVLTLVSAYIDLTLRRQDWSDMVIKDIEEGSPTSPLVVALCSKPSTS